MSEDRRFFARAAELASAREPFATATVVRAERPTSAKPGAKAIVTRAGALEGWIGGSCATPVVTREALAALVAGEARLIVLSSEPVAPREGVRQFPMTCHSGGALEIYIEPVLPPEQLVVVGRTPVARALAALGSALELRVVAVDPAATPQDFPSAEAVVRDLAAARVDARSAVVVATRGDWDETAVRAALATPAPYVALVASRRRGDRLREDLAAAGVAPSDLARLRYPAGLDIGARSEPEIALSILAEMVATRASRAAEPLPAELMGAQPAEATDPICGMTVAVTPRALTAMHEGMTYYFCSAGCQRRFLADPALE